MSCPPSTVLWSLSEGIAGSEGPHWPPAHPIYARALWNSPWRCQPLSKWTRAAAAPPPPRPRHHFPSCTLQASALRRTKSTYTPWTPRGQNIWEWIYDARLPLGLIKFLPSAFPAFLLFSFREVDCRSFKYWLTLSMLITSFSSRALPPLPPMLVWTTQPWQRIWGGGGLGGAVSSTGIIFTGAFLGLTLKNITFLSLLLMALHELRADLYFIFNTLVSTIIR